MVACRLEEAGEEEGEEEREGEGFFEVVGFLMAGRPGRRARRGSSWALGVGGGWLVVHRRSPRLISLR